MAGLVSPESPGDAWLRAVARAGQDLAEHRPGDAEVLRKAVLEHARALVPAPAHERWEVFVDVAAYEGNDDLTAAAGEALRAVAERLLSDLLVSELGDDEA